MSLEHIHLSQKAKDQLVKLKKITGIKNWNILCRWAFCISLAEPSVPPPTRIPIDSNVEMTWKVFGGQYYSIYHVLLKQRCKQDGLSINAQTLSDQFRFHLHRGIGYLAADKNIKDISSLLHNV
jgi:DNA sulfur modification protein DndE